MSTSQFIDFFFTFSNGSHVSFIYNSFRINRPQQQSPEGKIVIDNYLVFLKRFIQWPNHKLKFSGNQKIMQWRSSGSMLNKYPKFIPKEFRDRDQDNQPSSSQESSCSSRRSLISNPLDDDSGEVFKVKRATKQKNNSQAERAQNSNSLESSYFIGQVSREYGNLDIMAKQILDKIQSLQYNTAKVSELETDFVTLLRGHISFDDIWPLDQSSLGQRLISDGLFHEMWGKIIWQEKGKQLAWLYYQKYRQKIRSNHSNFQEMFNQQSSISAELNEENSNSSTRLKRVKTSKKEQAKEKGEKGKAAVIGLKQQQICCTVPNKERQTCKARRRIRLFEQIQNNSRRLNCEIVCFFLGIENIYKLEEISIAKILEYSLGLNCGMLIVQGHLQEPHSIFKCQQSLKRFLIVNGEVELREILRVKQSFGSVDGLVTFHETFSIQNWINKRIQQGGQINKQ